MKVNSVHVNPVDSNLVVTASNDWTVRLNDVRMIGPAAADSKGMHPPEHIACRNNSALLTVVSSVSLIACAMLKLPLRSVPGCLAAYALGVCKRNCKKVLVPDLCLTLHNCSNISHFGCSVLSQRIMFKFDCTGNACCQHAHCSLS